MYHSRLTIHPSVDEKNIFSFRQGAEDERDRSKERYSEVGDRMITRYYSRGIIHLVSFPEVSSIYLWMKKTCALSVRARRREREREEKQAMRE
jgi:hypothetical protein